MNVFLYIYIFSIFKSETETPGVKPESDDASLSIPIQLENGEVIKPVFTDLQVSRTYPKIFEKLYKTKLLNKNVVGISSTNMVSFP